MSWVVCRSPPKRARRADSAAGGAAACKGVLHPANGQRGGAARGGRTVGGGGVYVRCPICSLSLRESFLNSHLDSCAPPDTTCAISLDVMDRLVWQSYC